MPKSAVDYATDNITVYRFCHFNCLYCWAWRLPLFASRIKRGKYNPIEEAKRYLKIKEPRVIVVSFTADPYLPEEKEKKLTRKVLEVLSNARQHKVLILTKNPELALRDLDLMKKHGNMWLGTTITSLEPNIYEPRAPIPKRRLEALSKAHEQGIKTWISIEPIIPQITFPQAIIAKTKDYVDWYVLGALNYTTQLKLGYTKQELHSWYNEHVKQAIELLEFINNPYYIKKELKRWLQ